MSIDTDRFRTVLLEERERVQKAIANLRDDHPGSLDEEVEEIAATSDNHLAETASATLDREIDYTLEENSGHVLVALDAALKRIVNGRLGLGDAVHVIGPFSIRHVENSGIAFGLFASATALVILLTALAVVWMLVFFARSGARHPVLPVSLGLVIGGSLSNLLDRVRLGYVTDFLDLRYWPAFNLADSFIVIGVCLLLAALIAAEREPRRARHVRY